MLEWIVLGSRPVIGSVSTIVYRHGWVSSERFGMRAERCAAVGFLGAYGACRLRRVGWDCQS